MLKNFNTFQLAIIFYQTCKKIKLNKNLNNQLSRASSSIALNLAEGYGKKNFQDKHKYYDTAMGSLRECEAIFMLENIDNEELLLQVDILGASIYNLCQATLIPYKKK